MTIALNVRDIAIDITLYKLPKLSQINSNFTGIELRSSIAFPSVASSDAFIT